MKRIFISLITCIGLLALCVFSFGQDCNVYTIKTDVNAPAINTQRPAKTNTFDWIPSTYSLNSLYFPGSTNIESPYYQGSNTNITQLVLTQDMKPEDGWELIRRDFGYQDNGSPSAQPVFMPRVILYNKRIGMLRVLYARGELNTTYQTAFISLSWDQASPYQTSALDYAKALVPLDQPFVKNPFFQSPSNYFNAPLKWFYADFPIQYDPCTCFYQSIMNVRIKFYSTTDIKIEGISNGTIVSAGSNPATQDKDFLTSFQDAGKKAVQTFKSIDKFINKSKDKSSSDFTFNANIMNIKNSALEQLRPAIKDKPTFLKSFFSAVPYMDEALSLLEVFTGGGKASGPQQVELLPMNIEFNTKMSGTLTKIDEYEPDVFTTPGTATATSPAIYYPYYNKTMGIINLMNTPVGDMYSFYDIINPNTGQMQQYSEFKLRFSTPFKYALNPDADLAFFEEPQVAVLFKGANSYDPTQTSPMGGATFDWFGAVEAKDETGFIYRSNYIPISCLNDYTFRFTSAETWNELWYMTPFALKFRFNFSVVSNPSAQNVLHVQTYPIAFNTIYDPNQIPGTFSSGCYGASFFQQVSPSELTSICTNMSGYGLQHMSRRAPSGNTAEPINAGLTIVKLRPNPANKYVDVLYSVDKPMSVDIRIRNIQGQIVRSIRKNSRLERGTYSENFFVNDIPSGVYILEFVTDRSIVTKKLVIQK